MDEIVTFNHDGSDGPLGFKKGEAGYLKGFVRGADDRPYAVVMLGGKFLMVSMYSIELSV